MELVDSLDSGSSVHCGRAGSSPASPTSFFLTRSYGRVVELVDSLDSGSSVHCGRAGSSPASPTKGSRKVCVSVSSCFFLYTEREEEDTQMACCSILQHAVFSYYFSIKWLIPFYPALCAQAASGGEKCMDYVF